MICDLFVCDLFVDLWFVKSACFGARVGGRFGSDSPAACGPRSGLAFGLAVKLVARVSAFAAVCSDTGYVRRSPPDPWPGGLNWHFWFFFYFFFSSFKTTSFPNFHCPVFFPPRVAFQPRTKSVCSPCAQCVFSASLVSDLPQNSHSTFFFCFFFLTLCAYLTFPFLTTQAPVSERKLTPEHQKTLRQKPRSSKTRPHFKPPGTFPTGPYPALGPGASVPKHLFCENA